MLKASVLALPLFAALMSACMPATSAKPDAVTISGFAFQPATLNVKVGTTVTWTNTDAAHHTVTADDGSFNSGSLATGQSYSFTFTKVGTFAYHCGIHPFMKGAVQVSAP